MGRSVEKVSTGRTKTCWRVNYCSTVSFSNSWTTKFERKRREDPSQRCFLRNEEYFLPLPRTTAISSISNCRMVLQIHVNLQEKSSFSKKIWKIFLLENFCVWLLTVPLPALFVTFNTCTELVQHRCPGRVPFAVCRCWCIPLVVYLPRWLSFISWSIP
jgi:hypothetical protein